MISWPHVPGTMMEHISQNVSQNKTVFLYVASCQICGHSNRKVIDVLASTMVLCFLSFIILVCVPTYKMEVHCKAICCISRAAVHVSFYCWD